MRASVLDDSSDAEARLLWIDRELVIAFHDVAVVESTR
jgi:hypothetical protein